MKKKIIVDFLKNNKLNYIRYILLLKSRIINLYAYFFLKKHMILFNSKEILIN